MRVAKNGEQVTDIAKGDERLVDEDNIRMKKY